MFNENIMARVTEHAKVVRDKIPELAGSLMVVAANGSVNYGLETENSDVDTKAIYIPSVTDIVHQKCLSKTYSFTDAPNGEEHCDVKDIRMFVRMLEKSNINFIETLFSDYVWVNPKYGEEWAKLIDMREHIAYAHPVAAFDCMMGMATRYLAMIEDGRPNRNKAFYHVCRMKYAMQKFCEKAPYIEVIRPDKETADMLKAIKSEEGAKELGPTFYDEILPAVREGLGNFYVQRYKLQVHFPTSFDFSSVYDIAEDCIRKELS